jgi:3-oxoacyl-[acyl-carrier protein] reductase
MLEDVRKTFGEIDILVLNGGGPKPGYFLDTQLEDWDGAYNTTLRSMIELTHAAVPSMRARRWGRIVALTSTSVEQPIGNLVLSNAFRVALVAALKSLSSDVAADGITVNSIATGRVRTDRLRELYGDDEAMDRAAKAEVPIGRVATTEEYAPLAAFLCSESARYITGQTIAIDGGLTSGIFG